MGIRMKLLASAIIGTFIPIMTLGGPVAQADDCREYCDFSIHEKQKTCIYDSWSFSDSGFTFIYTAHLRQSTLWVKYIGGKRDGQVATSSVYSKTWISSSNPIDRYRLVSSKKTFRLRDTDANKILDSHVSKEEKESYYSPDTRFKSNNQRTSVTVGHMRSGKPHRCTANINFG